MFAFGDNVNNNEVMKEIISVNGRDVRVGSCIFAGDMDSMVRFYRDILGLHTQWDGGDFAEFETASGTLSLWLYSRKEFVKTIGESYIPPKKINQTFEIALWLPSFADVDAEYERLSKLGLCLPTGEPITYSFGIRNFYVADPEGNLLEIGSMNKA